MESNNSIDDGRDDNLVDFNLQPGVLSAIAFVTLEAIAIGLIDYATGRVLSWYYYRLLAKGQRIALQEANIPGVTRFQIGRRFAIHNVFATLSKIVVLALIFYINLSITSRTIRTEISPVQMATFVMSPSDTSWVHNYSYSVFREYDDSRQCYVKNGDNITFYPIVFNLTDGIVLENDVQPFDGNVTYNVNRSTIICASPEHVLGARPTAKVIGCSREIVGGCQNSSSISYAVPLSSSTGIAWKSNGGILYKRGDLIFNETIFDLNDVRTWIPDFPENNVSFRCLSYYVGAIVSELLRYTDCLYVYRPGYETRVEKWRYRKNHRDDNFSFLLNMPGPVFEGDVPIERSTSVTVLQIVNSDKFSRDDYFSLASDIVAVSGQFVGATKVYLPEENTVSSMPFVAIAFSFAIFTSAIFASVLVIIAMLRDSRPRLNTIFGLSTVMRHHILRVKNKRKSLDGSDQYPVLDVDDDANAKVVFVSLSPEDANQHDPEKISKLYRQ